MSKVQRIHPAGKGQLLVYQTADGRTKLDVRLEHETVWLSQAAMAELFQCSTDNISLHIKNIVEEGEIDLASTTEDFSMVRLEGSREVLRKIAHYNLDVIISVGYRVKSAVATRFRVWAQHFLYPLHPLYPCSSSFPAFPPGLFALLRPVSTRFSERSKAFGTGMKGMQGITRKKVAPMGSKRIREEQNILITVSEVRTAREVSGHSVADHFVGVNKMVELGSGSLREIDDILLLRHGAARMTPAIWIMQRKTQRGGHACVASGENRGSQRKAGKRTRRTGQFGSFALFPPRSSSVLRASALGFFAAIRAMKRMSPRLSCGCENPLKAMMGSMPRNEP